MWWDCVGLGKVLFSAGMDPSARVVAPPSATEQSDRNGPMDGTPCRAVPCLTTPVPCLTTPVPCRATLRSPHHVIPPCQLQVPRTLDSMRVTEETMVEPDDEEVLADEEVR